MDFRLDNTEAARDFVALLVEDLERALPAAEATFAEVRTLFLLAILFTSFRLELQGGGADGGGVRMSKSLQIKFNPSVQRSQYKNTESTVVNRG